MIYLDWVDACSIDDWEELEEIKKENAPRIETCGHLIGETDKFLFVSLNLDKTNEKASCSMIIPKGWIIRRMEFDIEKIIKTAKVAEKRSRKKRRIS